MPRESLRSVDDLACPPHHRKPGRPASIRESSRQVAFRVEETMEARINQYRGRHVAPPTPTFSDAVRDLIECGLKRKGL